MMDLESLRYFMETAKSLSISKTAESLYISQQTLSNHIHRVEDYYNVPLFNRQPRLQLTSAGREVLKYAENMFEKEKALTAHLSDLGNTDVGRIDIAVTSPRCNAYLPQVLQKYRSIYPKVQIYSIEGTNNELDNLVQTNQVDFAVAGYIEGSHSNIHVYSSYEDLIYLCVSDRLLFEYYTPEEVLEIKRKSLKGADVSDFSRLPFMIPTNQNRLGAKVLQCFQVTKCIPNIYFSSKHTTIIIPLCNQGLAAGFTSNMNLSIWYPLLNDDINVFPLCLNGSPVTITIRIIYHNQHYLNHFVKSFLKLTAETLDSLEHKDLSRLSPFPPV